MYHILPIVVTANLDEKLRKQAMENGQEVEIQGNLLLAFSVFSIVYKILCTFSALLHSFSESSMLS